MKQAPPIILFVFLVSATIARSTLIHVPQDQPTIQAGIDVATKGDTVLVDTGIYVENINFNGKNVVVGSLLLTTGDTSYISQTIIDGDSSGSVVTFESGEDSTASLIGFVITNGKGANRPEAAGGGITSKNYSKPTLSHLIVKGNTNFYNGGGIHCRYGSFILRNSLITENISSMGGGIDCHWCPEPLLEKVIIKKNIAKDRGGGILSWDSDMILDNVIVSENEAGVTGGGIQIGDGEVSLKNVVVSKNTVEFDGGGIYCEYYSVTNLTSVTLADNHSGYGGGIYVMSSAKVNVINAVLWNDSPDEIQFDPSSNPGTTTIAYSDVQGGGEGITTNSKGIINWLEGNIESDPLFADPEHEDFNLQQGSPAIDAGTAFFVWDEDTIVDLTDTAYQGSAPDMGAFESSYTASTVSDDAIPTEFSLKQNYPNPFNPATTIRYDLPQAGRVSLAIYDVLGREVAVEVDSWQEAGTHEVVWSATDVPSGIYFVRMVSGAPSASSPLKDAGQAGQRFSQVRKVVVLR